MTTFCLAGRRDNFYKNYRLRTGVGPWWFYFPQIGSMLAANPAFTWLLQISKDALPSASGSCLCPGHSFHSSTIYCTGLGMKRYGREKVMEEMHQAANTPCIQSTSRRKRNEYKNSDRSRVECIEREENNIQGMQGECKNLRDSLKQHKKKDMSVWGREADAVRVDKKAKRKQEIRRKCNFF